MITETIAFVSYHYHFRYHCGCLNSLITSKRNIFQSDFELGDEFAVLTRRHVDARATLLVNPNRLQVEPCSFPPLDVKDDNMLSPTPSIARYNSETCPPVYNAVRLFGEQDLDDNNENEDPNESDAVAQDAFLEKIDMVTTLSAPKGLSFQHLKRIRDKLSPLDESLSIGVLIGSNCPLVIKPKEVIAGKSEDPYAVRSLLGWCIVGPTGQSDAVADQYASSMCN